MDDEPPPPSDPTPHQPILCPNCGAPASSQGPVIHCPSCDADFFAATGEQTDGCAVEWEAPSPPDDELDGLRIRKLVQAKRSTIRARTYAVVILICCLVMGVQLILTDFQEVHLYGWDFWAILYTISAAAMAILATIASRKAALLHRESLLSDTTDPEHAPQFDDLSDGSQHVENLKEMMNDE